MEAVDRRISDQNLGVLLASVGNHEGKALTLIAMADKHLYTSRDLHKKVMRAQGTTPAWKTNHFIQFEYCRNSFEPIGLVAQEVLNPDLSTYGYQLTDFGVKAAIPLAGHLLRYSETHPDLSLFGLFGATQSTGKGEVETKKRSPLLRAKIFWELTTGELPLRTIDLARNIGGDYGKIIHVHLDVLGRRRIINYEAQNVDKAVTLYKVLAENIDAEPKFDIFPNVGVRLWSFLKTHPDELYTSKELAEEMFKGGTRSKKTTLDSVEGQVYRMLGFLHTQGVVEKSKFSAGVRSAINLTLEQRVRLVTLLDILDRFQLGDSEFYKDGYTSALDIFNNPQRMSALMDKARNSSLLASQIPVAELTDNIVEIVSKNPKVGSAAITELLYDQIGLLISKVALHRHLKSLMESGRLALFHKANGQYWVVPE